MYTMALFGRFLEGENAFGDASDSESNNDGNDAVANFTGNRYSRRRQVNGMLDVERRKCNGVAYTNV